MKWLEARGVFWRPPKVRSKALVEADVRAEIEHHLAAKEHELLEHGLCPKDARAEALRCFGDVALVQEDCVRLQTGETVMLQRMHFALTFLLLVSLTFLGWNNVESRRAAAEADKLAAARDELQVLSREVQQHMASLSKHMASLSKQKPAPVEQIILGVGDELELIDAYGTIHVTETIAADGNVLVPSAGWVQVSGLTRAQAEKKLNESLAPYYVEVDVKVKVLDPARSMQSVMFEAF